MSKEQTVGVILLLLIVPVILIPLHYGLVTNIMGITDEVIAILVATLLISGAGLLFKDIIFGKKELTIPISELKSTGEVKELEVRFGNGDIRRNRVCFYYVTVRTKGQRTVKNVMASLDGNPLNIAPRTEKPSFGVDYDRLSPERFDKAKPLEFVFALLRERKKIVDRIQYLHPGPGQDFVLFFGVEGLNDFYPLSRTYLWYDPRRGLCGLQRDDGTGTLRLRLHLDGQDAKSCDAMFEVKFQKWNSFSVTSVKLPQ